MPKGPSPTQRTLNYYRDLGYDIGVVERHNHFSGQKNDLFGFVDLVALDDDHTHLIQATSTSNMSARKKKILENEVARRRISNPSVRVFVIGWKKYAKPENRRFWRETVWEITEGDFGGDQH